VGRPCGLTSAEYAVQAQDRIGRFLRPATYCREAKEE
jgi:hypothetical protein